MRWSALRVGERLHFVIEEAWGQPLLGLVREGTVTELRPWTETQDVAKNIIVVCRLDQALPFDGERLHEVLLRPRHRQTLTVTLLSRYQAVYVSPVLPGPYDFKTVFGLAWLRRLSAWHKPSSAR